MLMALAPNEFERMFQELIPQLTSEERALLERIYDVKYHGKTPQGVLPEPGKARQIIWNQLQEKLAKGPWRRGNGNG